MSNDDGTPEACFNTEVSSTSCIDTEINGSSCISTEIKSTACINPGKPIDFDYEIYQETESDIGYVAYDEGPNTFQGVIEVQEIIS